MRMLNLNNFIRSVIGLLMGIVVVSCSQVQTLPTKEPSLPPPVVRTINPTAAWTPTPALTPRPRVVSTSTPEPTIVPTNTATIGPYAGLSIDELAGRDYGGGDLMIQETLAENSYFVRSLVSYPSDDLTIYGFMNTPNRPSQASNGRYPVIIALHGYIDPQIYQTIDYTTRYADALARSGFLVLHPNLRGYPPSDEGDNRFRVGMAIDVLNLINLVKEQAGKPGSLENADPDSIGIWGHSMGGGIATRVITVSPDVRAAVLYGAMSGDDKQNFERIYGYFSNGTRGLEELQAPDEVFQFISPINYLDRIQSAVSIHHGKLDPEVPLTWSLDLCRRLNQLSAPVECFTYDDQAHTFHGEGDNLFIQRMVEFFTKQLIDR